MAASLVLVWAVCRHKLGRAVIGFTTVLLVATALVGRGSLPLLASRLDVVATAMR